MKALDPFRNFSVQALFHFTDSRNLPSIQKLGGLYSTRELKTRGVEVVCPGGNQWSRDADVQSGMDKYVHLCLRKSHPMEYLAKKDGRIRNSVFLEIDPGVRHIEGAVFTCGVSNKSGVQTHPMQEAFELIDFEVLYTKMDWKVPDIRTRLHAAEKCEILVPDHVPLKYIRKLPYG